MKCCVDSVGNGVSIKSEKHSTLLEPFNWLGFDIVEYRKMQDALEYKGPFPIHPSRVSPGYDRPRISSVPRNIQGPSIFGITPRKATATPGVGESVEDIASIRLISGQSADSSQIDFNPSNYHFTLNGVDITNDIYRADKLRLVEDFSIERENLRLSSEAPASNTPSGAGLDPLTESTLGIFAGQIFTDPLAAPLGALDKGVGQFFGSSGIQTILVIGGLAFVAYMLLKDK